MALDIETLLVAPTTGNLHIDSVVLYRLGQYAANESHSLANRARAVRHMSAVMGCKVDDMSDTDLVNQFMTEEAEYAHRCNQ